MTSFRLFDVFAETNLHYLKFVENNVDRGNGHFFNSIKWHSLEDEGEGEGGNALSPL